MWRRSLIEWDYLFPLYFSLFEIKSQTSSGKTAVQRTGSCVKQAQFSINVRQPVPDADFQLNLDFFLISLYEERIFGIHLDSNIFLHAFFAHHLAGYRRYVIVHCFWNTNKMVYAKPIDFLLEIDCKFMIKIAADFYHMPNVSLCVHWYFTILELKILYTKFYRKNNNHHHQPNAVHYWT